MSTTVNYRNHLIALGLLVAGLGVFLLLPESTIRSTSQTMPGLKISSSEAGTPLWAVGHDITFDDDVAQQLIAVPTLETLQLFDTTAEPTALDSLRHLKQLRSITLWNVECPDGKLDWVPTLDKLDELRLHKCRWVDDAAVAHLAEAQKIKVLDLSHASITDASLEVVAKLPELRQVMLQFCTGLTPQGLAKLKACPQLTQIAMPGVPMSSGEYRTLTETLNESPDRRITLGQEVQYLTDFVPEWSRFAYGWHPGSENNAIDYDAAVWRVSNLSFHEAEVGPETYDQLKAFTNIRTIRFENAILKQGALAGLEQWREVSRLSFQNVTFDEGATDRLPPLPNLVSLTLGSAAIDDAFLEQFIECTSLGSVGLFNTKVTPDGLSLFASLPELTSLQLTSKRINNKEMIRAVGSISSLEVVELYGPYEYSQDFLARDEQGEPVEPDPAAGGLDLSPIAQLPKLHQLGLYASTINDESLLQLADCPKLVFVRYGACPHITEAGLAALREARPDMEVRQ